MLEVKGHLSISGLFADNIFGSSKNEIFLILRSAVNCIVYESKFLSLNTLCTGRTVFLAVSIECIGCVLNPIPCLIGICPICTIL